jgi:histidine triad (HIT) family protein
MKDCLFCKIIAGEIPGSKVFENDKVFAFRDINPQAPVHVLIVPKKHMANVRECDGETAAALAEAAGQIARQEGVAESGFRLISNCGRDGAQSVNHLHVHLLGGVQLTEKMN